MMLKTFLPFLYLLTLIGIATPSFTQNIAPNIVWQRCIGGSQMELFGNIIQVGDGNYVLAGFTRSNDGDVTCLVGNVDLLVMKLGPDSEILWQRCFDYYSTGTRLYAATDGGFFLVGATDSSECVNPHGNGDAWIAKINTNGETEWQRCFGGTGADYAKAMHQTSDGGFVLLCQTTSNDGDVSGNHGDADAWIIKLEASGEIQWQKCLGGTNSEDVRDISQTPDGGYILALQTNSEDGDVFGLHGEEDYWVVRLDASGEIQWQKCLGGANEDYLQTLLQVADGGFLLSGFTASTDGDVSGNHGSYDFWVVKLEASGEIQWQKCYGGTDAELNNYTTIATADGGFIITGETYSHDGDVSGNQGGYDAWLLKIDANGEIQWQKTMGGSGNDRGEDIEHTADGGFIMAGTTNSNDGDVSGAHGSLDFWVVKLEGTSVAVNESDIEHGLRLYPSPNQGLFTIEMDGLLTDRVELGLFHLDGRLLRQETVKNVNRSLSHQFDCGDVPSGLYLLSVGSGGETRYIKVIVQR